MNTYEMLLDFLMKIQTEDIPLKIMNYFQSIKIRFIEDLTYKDKYFDCLKMQDDQISTLAVQVAQTLFASFFINYSKWR